MNPYLRNLIFIFLLLCYQSIDQTTQRNGCSSGGHPDADLGEITREMFVPIQMR